MYAKQVVTFRLTDEILKQVDERAKEVGITRSEWLARVVAYGLARKDANLTITHTEKVTI